AYQGAVFFSDYIRDCMWVIQKGANGLPDNSTVKTFIDDSAGIRAVDIESNPGTGGLWYVDIRRGAVPPVSYPRPRGRAPAGARFAGPPTAPTPPIQNRSPRADETVCNRPSNVSSPSPVLRARACTACSRSSC